MCGVGWVRVGHAVCWYDFVVANGCAGLVLLDHVVNLHEVGVEVLECVRRADHPNNDDWLIAGSLRIKRIINFIVVLLRFYPRVVGVDHPDSDVLVGSEVFVDLFENVGFCVLGLEFK